jgi:hypothetical protein
MLAVSVTLEDPLDKIPGAVDLSNDSADWWRPLFDTDDASFKRIKQRQLDHWLRFTKHGRILYRSFIEQVLEFKFEPQRLTGADSGREVDQPWRFEDADGRTDDDLSPIVYWLLQRFFAPPDAAQDYVRGLHDQLRLQYLCEERMFVNVAYALCGETPVGELGLAQRDRLFSLALYVDRESDGWSSQQGYVYDRTYIERLLAGDGEGTPGHRLDRWRGIGTLSGYCLYANAYLGSGNMFSNVIAPGHVPFHYERMLILVLFYQLTLRGYNRRISHATKRLVDRSAVAATSGDPGAAFRKLRRDFIEFTNNHWFHEITLAIQGKEIFARQVAAAELSHEYAQIKDEMERADEYTAALREQRMNSQVFALTIIGLVIAGLALPWKDWGAVLSAALLVPFATWVICQFTDWRRGPCRWLRPLAQAFGLMQD